MAKSRVLLILSCVSPGRPNIKLAPTLIPAFSRLLIINFLDLKIGPKYLPIIFPKSEDFLNLKILKIKKNILIKKY